MEIYHVTHEGRIAIFRAASLVFFVETYPHRPSSFVSPKPRCGKSGRERDLTVACSLWWGVLCLIQKLSVESRTEATDVGAGLPIATNATP